MKLTQRERRIFDELEQQFAESSQAEPTRLGVIRQPSPRPRMVISILLLLADLVLFAVGVQLHALPLLVAALLLLPTSAGAVVGASAARLARLQ